MLSNFLRQHPAMKLESSGDNDRNWEGRNLRKLLGIIVTSPAWSTRLPEFDTITLRTRTVWRQDYEAPYAKLVLRPKILVNIIVKAEAAEVLWGKEEERKLYDRALLTDLSLLHPQEGGMLGYLAVKISCVSDGVEQYTPLYPGLDLYGQNENLFWDGDKLKKGWEQRKDPSKRVHWYGCTTWVDFLSTRTHNLCEQ
jgi:hypothetical protein